MSRQSTPLLVSLAAIAALTTVAAATNHPAAQPDPTTTNAFQQLAQRTGGQLSSHSLDSASTSGAAMVVAPQAPGAFNALWRAGA